LNPAFPNTASSEEAKAIHTTLVLLFLSGVKKHYENSHTNIDYNDALLLQKGRE
jgi:hypothetical protein